VLANDTDAEQDAMTVLVAAPPSHGSFVANPNGSFTYAPDRNFNGVDTWSYRASDGWNLSDETLVRITVRPVNDPPSASPRGFVLDQGLPAAIGLAVDDGDPEVAQAFTLTVVAPPEHGDLSDFDPFTGEVTYTPRGAYFGPDQFSFTVTDDAQAGAPAGATSDLAAVTLQVAPRVSLPAASKDTSFLLKRNGSHVQLVNTRTKKPVFDASGDRVWRLTVLGAAGKAETLSIDPSAIVAGSGLQGGVIFDGLPGGKGDVLVLRGTAKRDTFHLGPGAATVNGLDIQSPDVEQLIFDGGADNDTYQIAGLSTSVTIVDSKGIDVLDFSQATAAVNLDLNKSRSQEIFAATNATLALKGTLETVIGTPQADVLRGNSVANKIWGGAGDDTIYGGGGYDLLYGEDGDDWLYGDADNDLLFGGLGSNVLVGGDGNDILDASGSPGRGLLIGGKGSDRLTASRGDCILIGGTTSYDTKAAALAAVMREWTSGNSFDARCTKLDAGFTDDPLVGFIQLKRKTKTSGTVIDDKVRDQLFGGQGSDWLLNFNKDETQ
jgi:Ca2+-binding RTX toxin-like protein